MKTAKQLWRMYQDAKGSGALADLSIEQQDAACKIHSEWLRVDRRVRVRRVNVNAAQRALDCGGDTYPLADGEEIIMGATFIEGSPEALNELADYIDELAEGNIRGISDYWEISNPAMVESGVRAQVAAAYRVARKLREGCAEASA